MNLQTLPADIHYLILKQLVLIEDYEVHQDKCAKVLWKRDCQIVDPSSDTVQLPNSTRFPHFTFAPTLWFLTRAWRRIRPALAGLDRDDPATARTVVLSAFPTWMRRTFVETKNEDGTGSGYLDLLWRQYRMTKFEEDDPDNVMLSSYTAIEDEYERLSIGDEKGPVPAGMHMFSSKWLGRMRESGDLTSGKALKVLPCLIRRYA
ncbi:hypothetical protein FQN54_004084 [Arachnomyces sp. PD_36]|nr:hypothetical protein FQN54_004084 [Arachnomyces sp. PD_36]